MAANLIYTAPSGGTIWQGGYEDVINLEFEELVAARENRKPVYTDLVVLCANGFQGKVWAPNNIQVIRIPFDDTTNLSEGDVKTIVRMVDGASTWVAKYVREGKRVLITCAAGINRSGLTTAFSLMKLDPKFAMNPDLAIETIRGARYGALCNPEFVNIIRSFGTS